MCAYPKALSSVQILNVLQHILNVIMHFVAAHTGFSHIRKLSATSNTWDYGNTVLISSDTHTISLINCLMAAITFSVRSIMSFENGFYQVSDKFLSWQVFDLSAYKLDLHTDLL
jgi:hypothetical protein